MQSFLSFLFHKALGSIFWEAWIISPQRTALMKKGDSLPRHMDEEDNKELQGAVSYHTQSYSVEHMEDRGEGMGPHRASKEL